MTLHRGMPAFLVVAQMLLASIATPARAEDKTVPPRIHLDAPAPKLEHTLPLDNAALVARLFGHIGQEELVLSSRAVGALSSSGRAGTDILEGLKAGRWPPPDSALAAPMDPGPPVGTLKLEMSQLSLPPRDYTRELDLVTGVLSVQYQCGDMGISRDAFASKADNVLVVRASCYHPGMIDLWASYKPPSDSSLKHRLRIRSREEMIIFLGFEKTDIEKQPAMVLLIRVVPANGRTVASRTGLEVQEADEVVVLVAAAARGGDGADPVERCEQIMAAAARKSHTQLLKTHEAEHAKAFGKIALPAGPCDHLSFDKRLQAATKGEKDPTLAALYQQYVRYLRLRR
ncbi:MAG: hypothetical protein BWX88_02102 [Planctomycetes bacterium ADurb.Bin126]|nr:MAG: hypothetical protein BWX88_02102 [Planctomycetes bacterium ADurb.Bin126]